MSRAMTASTTLDPSAPSSDAVADRPSPRTGRTPARSGVGAERPSLVATGILLLGALYCLLPVLWVLLLWPCMRARCRPACPAGTRVTYPAPAAGQGPGPGGCAWGRAGGRPWDAGSGGRSELCGCCYPRRDVCPVGAGAAQASKGCSVGTVAAPQ